MALKTLREYYNSKVKDHEAASGAGTSIVGLLEVCLSDFTKSLAEITAAEELKGVLGHDFHGFLISLFLAFPPPFA